MTDGESRISDADYDLLVRELRKPRGLLERRPSAETLAWVAASMGPSSRVVGFRRLRGGVWSAANRVTVAGWAEAIPIQVAGRCPLDLAGMTGRVEVAVETALRRLR
jgi:hypothetical protein